MEPLNAEPIDLMTLEEFFPPTMAVMAATPTMSARMLSALSPMAVSLESGAGRPEAPRLTRTYVQLDLLALCF